MRGAVLLAVLLCIGASLEALNRTPWGDPDIQGVWSNQNPASLERPDALKGRSTLTAAEAAEFEKSSLDRLLNVVETTNYNDKKRFRGATRQMRLVERFTRVDADTIEYRLRVADPATFARPCTNQNGLRKADGDLCEVGRLEGNYGLRGIRAGARAEESRR